MSASEPSAMNFERNSYKVFSKYCSGDLSALEPLDPFPNSKVKRGSDDDSCGATYRENSSSPEQYLEFFTNSYCSGDKLVLSPEQYFEAKLIPMKIGIFCGLAPLC